MNRRIRRALWGEIDPPESAKAPQVVQGWLFPPDDPATSPALELCHSCQAMHNVGESCPCGATGTPARGAS